MMTQLAHVLFRRASGVILPMRYEGMFVASVDVPFVSYLDDGLCVWQQEAARGRKPRLCRIEKSVAGWPRCGLGMKDV